MGFIGHSRPFLGHISPIMEPRGGKWRSAIVGIYMRASNGYCKILLKYGYL